MTQPVLILPCISHDQKFHDIVVAIPDEKSHHITYESRIKLCLLTLFQFEWYNSPCHALNHQYQPSSLDLSCDKLNILLILYSIDWKSRKRSEFNQDFRLVCLSNYLPIKLASSGWELPCSKTMFDVAGQSIEKWFANDLGCNLKIEWVAKVFLFLFFKFLFLFFYRSNCFSQVFLNLRARMGILMGFGW